MLNSRRSASVGALPAEKRHFVSRAESASGASMEVRCACQFFESESLLPERINPVDSRPGSRLSQHAEEQFPGAHLNLLSDDLSAHSFEVVSHADVAPSVDLSFMERYPELEQTARSRGLVVRSISDATEPDFPGQHHQQQQLGGVGGGFVAGRRRQLSMGGLSSGSMGRFPDTLSMRSGTSLRRISAGNSRADLYCADINIPNAASGAAGGRRSASTSRRASNADLFQASIVPGSQQPPQLNLIPATALPGMMEQPPQFPSHQPSPAPSQQQDFRIAKPPLSTDYMRPSEANKENQFPGDTLPQNRPIDVSRFGGDAVRPSFLLESDLQQFQNPYKPTVTPIDPLAETVAELEQIAQEHSIVRIRDNIQSETRRPPSIGGDLSAAPLKVDELTKIEIIHDIPVVDIDQLLREEEAKAAEHRSRSPRPTPRRPKSPPVMATLQLPSSRTTSPSPAETVLPSAAGQQLLKRQHTPERQLSPERASKWAPQEEPVVINLQDASPEVRSTYTSRFKSMFGAKDPGQRSRSPSPAVQTIPRSQYTPERQLSPERPSRWTPQQPNVLVANAPSANLQEVTPEVKGSYTSRFKSMFGAKEPAIQRSRSPSPAAQPILRSQYTPERQLSPEHASKWTPQQENVFVTNSPPDALPEVKSSYTSRFKSMFGGKESRGKSPSPSLQRSRTPSPKLDRLEKSPMLSVFNRGKAMSIVTTSTAAIKGKEAEPLAVRVTETFSLKVDEMDQYCVRPPKPPAPPPSAQTMYSSREDFAASERASDRISVDISEAFAPVVVSAVPRGGSFSQSASMNLSMTGSGGSFMAGNRNLYSSEIGGPESGYSRTDSASRDVSMGGSRPLISVPIQISGSGSGSRSNVYRPLHQRAPSEQRGFGVQRKSSFREPRTQSYDRGSRLGRSQEQLFGAERMTKTVSFHFDERKSRLADFESNANPLTPKQLEHRDFLERTYFSRDHEYEPVGGSSPAPSTQAELQLPMDIDAALSSAGTTPRTESRTDYEIHTSQVDSSALEELPLQPENRRKGFMASAQDRTKKMQDGIRQQAGKLRTRLQTKPKPKPVSGSPKAKAKERRRFKAPEFSKIKMPEIKRPDMSKLKDLKRPEFTKFNKPDMSKFKLPEKLSTLKLRRSKSFKENEGELPSEDTQENTGTTASPTQAQPAPKKKFEFNFGTYPRAFRKKKPEEPAPVAMESSLGTEGLSLSVIPSTETQPSQTSTSSPQGDRGPGPVRSRWADKFSDVSYNDSEGSRYRRYGSELESFDRESSLERRMKEDLEGTEDTASEAQPQPEMGILGAVADSKQFAEFDEENRAIHEISSKRSREFKRRPMVHQDSDLRSEDSRDAEGWTEKDIQKNKLLRKAELEAEAGFYKFHDLQDAQSTASSGKKVVMEPIDDDEFFLRKRGISEDNIQLRQYISEAIREGYDMPNALKHVGYSAEQVPAEFADYDVPPAKPRRLPRNYQPEFDSQEFQRSDYGDDLSMSQNGSEFTPKRPLRKARSRSKYSIEGSQDIPMADGGSSIQYFDDDEEYLRPPIRDQQAAVDSEQALNNLDIGGRAAAMIQEELEKERQKTRPQAPRRQKKRTRDDASVEKDADSFINGFGGRSVSNTFLQPHEDVIVYRTEHEYRHIPLATPDRFTDGASARTQRSEDDRTSRGADSLILDVHTKTRPELEDNEEGVPRTKSDEKFVIDMLESDGYESQKVQPPEEEDDYEEPGALGRPESPRSNLQSGEIINKMKFRPLPPPPRPPREKRSARGGSQTLDSYDESEHVASSSQADSYDQGEFEVEVSTQTDPLPDDFVCEEFEITEDMKIIEPRRSNGSGNKTLEDLLRSVEAAQEPDEVDGARVLTEDEQLAKGLQRFRDANQRSMSERSRASSQADRSKSLSRPQTPSSAVVIERRVPTPSLSAGEDDAAVQASLIVRPISAADLEDDELRREEEELRREGLLSDSSVQSKSDVEEEDHGGEVVLSDYAASSADLDAAVEQLQQAQLESDYESRLEDDEVERTLRDNEYEDEKYSEQEEEEEIAKLEKELTEQELEEALEKELQEAMEKELSDYRQKEKEQELELAFSEEEPAASEIDYQQSEEEKATSELDYRQSEDEHPLSAEEHTLSEEERTLLSDTEQHLSEPEIPAVEETIQKSTASEPTEAEVELKFVATLPTEPAYGHEEEDEEQEPGVVPLPPPRRRSTTALEPTTAVSLTIAEHSSRELTPIQSVQSPPEPQLPSRLADLEVERLRVHALQAGQIQVSQLHGAQIKADDLQCKSGQLVVQNIELPPGFIDDIVERVQREQRTSLLTSETQTSRQPSSEPATSEKEQPIKPPRHSKLTEQAPPIANLDEQTQTETGLLPLPPPPTAYPTVEYLQSLAPLAFYNLQRSAEAEQAEASSAADRKAPHKCRRRHVAQEHLEEESGSELEEQLVERPRSRSRRSRTRSATQPPEDEYDEDQPKTVVQAGRQFISACSLELVNIINQLTHYVRGEAVEPQQAPRNVSALMVLFILITFGVLIFLLTGRQVHTHHWDYFNPPGNEGRQT
ncbi:microtubule-associated protein futsch isoform X3 [Drosophila kikkawai]|uniref:Microtubule-associated protein futsch isoform X3 n=1 Tax=Drosophila kikkawai TaxID=30033 RepID=A0ABM4GF30_DROKI